MAKVNMFRFLVASLITLCALVSASAEDEKRLITVTGGAAVRVQADEVIIRLGTETSDKNIEIAQKKNDEIVKKLIAAVKSNGVPAKFIKTDFIHVEPRYQSYRERREFIGYFVKNTMVITLKEIAVFEKLLSEVLKAGANRVHGIQFQTTELRKHRDRARELALKAALEKARDMASVLNQKVGKPHTIKEIPSGWGSSYYAYQGRGIPQQVVQAAPGASGIIVGPLAAGQISVWANVTVSFELE